jgi:glycosyltransferase involved in cell wall biosynthesis
MTDTLPSRRGGRDRRERVVVAITLAEIGGAQAYVAALLPALVEHYDVVVAAHGRGPLRDRALAAGARYVELRWVRRALGWRDLVGLAELVALLIRERPALIHLNSSKMGILGRLAAFVARVPATVFTVHGWAFAAHEGLAARLYRLADRVVRPLTTAFVCPSAHQAQLGERVGTSVPERTVVIPNAIDVGAFAQAPLDGSPPLLASVGRLQAPKDFVTLAHALGQLPAGSFRALIVGDGPDREAVATALREAGVTDNVKLAGELPGAAEALANADVFILSSRSECFPISILEAMATGLPVVASAVGGVAEEVVDGETGLLVAPADADGLADALRRLVTDAALRRRLGAAGRARAVAYFDLPAFHTAHLELYERILHPTVSRPF